MNDHKWGDTTGNPSRRYTCGYCGASLASNVGYHSEGGNSPSRKAFIYICHYCRQPTFFDEPDGKQTPGTSFGRAVKDIPDQLLNDLYEEARRATSAGSYTAAVLCCRKLLMHIAVEKEADEGKNFKYYVEYLADNHYFPPDAKDWVDHIREKGNEANHEIVIMDKQDAEDLISSIEMLLIFIYEYPARVKSPTTETTP